MNEAEHRSPTVRLERGLVADARRIARLCDRSIAKQIEYWARLGQAVESSPDFSIGNVDAALAGTMNIETLSALERIAYFERISEIFNNPSSAIKAAYADLSEDPETGT